MTPVVSAAEDENVSIASEAVSVPSDLSPLRSCMAGFRSVRSWPPQPMEILTGTTLPFWTVLYTPSSSGGRKCASYTLTTSEVTDADSPPSLSVAVALTEWSPQSEKLWSRGLPVKELATPSTNQA